MNITVLNQVLLGNINFKDITMKIKLIIGVVLLNLSSSFVYAETSVGRTMVARGDVNATSTQSSETRKLKRRSNIFQSDKVTTGAASKTQLRMKDGGMISLKENSELLITEYQGAQKDEKGSVVLSLVKGGLRSITGAIKEEKGSYKLKTSVATIGIRGTHYEIEIIDGELFLAVWDGAIDISFDNDTENNFSLGDLESYSYAKIDLEGIVNFLLAPPQNFEEGMSSPKTKNVVGTTKKVVPKIDAKTGITPVKPHDVVTVLAGDKLVNTFPDRIDTLEEQNLFELVSNKTGSLQYSGAVITSEQTLTDVSFGFNINFDNGTINNGELAFNDDQSADRWTAVFNGNMNLTDNNVNLEMDITFAAHGDVQADGNIGGSFVETTGLDAVVGGFELFEESGDARVGGNYIVTASEANGDR